LPFFEGEGKQTKITKEKKNRRILRVLVHAQVGALHIIKGIKIKKEGSVSKGAHNSKKKII